MCISKPSVAPGTLISRHCLLIVEGQVRNATTLKVGSVPSDKKVELQLVAHDRICESYPKIPSDSPRTEYCYLITVNGRRTLSELYRLAQLL